MEPKGFSELVEVASGEGVVAAEVLAEDEAEESPGWYPVVSVMVIPTVTPGEWSGGDAGATSLDTSLTGGMAEVEEVVDDEVPE